MGLALTKWLLRKGVKVALWDLNQQLLEQRASELGDSIKIQRLDICNLVEARTAAADVISAWGRIDILVNSAGITGQTNLKSHEVDLADFERVLHVNLTGALVAFQAVMPYMLQRDYGRILHLTSIAGKEGNAGMLAYSASKAAVIGLTKVQAKEYADTNIRINALAPAVILTDMVSALPESQVRYMTEKIPLKRCGTLDEFADMAGFIVSRENSFSTGFTFDLSGGRAVY